MTTREIVMHNTQRRLSTHNRAFTIVELLVVIVIILLLMGLLIPALSGARNSAKKASTLSLMQSVSTGVSQFRADKGRMPGFYTQEQLGQGANTNKGLTVMENALVDLAGGLLPSETAVPSGNTSLIRLIYKGGMRPETRAVVDTTLIGAPDGPSYLNLPSDIFKPVAGQFHDAEAVRSGMDRMPDVIDPFGQPLLLWIRNPAAGSGATFARDEAPPEGTPIEETRSMFYAAGNAGMLRASQLGNFKRNQNLASVLGQYGGGGPGGSSGGDPSGADMISDRSRSLTALLGHPDLPMNDVNYVDGYPSAPLGDAAIHSAGADGVYLSNDSGKLKRAAYRTPRNTQAASESKEISRFDDVVLPAG